MSGSSRFIILTMRTLSTVSFLLAVSALLPAQSWTPVPTNNAPPAQGYGASIAYHFGTGRTVLHGGRGTAVSADTWTFDGIDWQLEAPQNSPGARWAHRLVQDTGSGRVLLFGGRDAGTTAQNETWAWDGADWTRIPTANAPSPRAFHQMAYDSRRGITVVFGGFGVLDSQTWEFDGLDWVGRATATVPPIVGDGQMVYDASRGVCVLFGGWDGRARVYASTWEYDGDDWRPVTTRATPPLRQWHQMSYDPIFQHVVMHGGFGGGVFNDCWIYDGADWTQVFPAGAPPTVPVQAGMTYDFARVTHVEFGGSGPAGRSQETTDFQSLALPSFAWAGAGCAGSQGTPVLESAMGSTARVGTNLVMEVRGVPSSSAVLLVGFSNQVLGPFRLPYALDGLGLVGCSLYTSIEASAAGAATGGVARFSLAMPAQFAGQSFWAQAFVPDTAAPGFAVLSNACRAYIAP